MNKCITIDNKSIFFKTWFEKGIRLIKDLLTPTNKFSNFTQLNDKYGTNCNFLDLLSVLHAIPYHWRNTINTMDLETVEFSYNMKIIKNDKAIHVKVADLKTKDVYKCLLKIALKQ